MVQLEIVKTLIKRPPIELFSNGSKFLVANSRLNLRPAHEPCGSTHQRLDELAPLFSLEEVPRRRWRGALLADTPLLHQHENVVAAAQLCRLSFQDADYDVLRIAFYAEAVAYRVAIVRWTKIMAGMNNASVGQPDKVAVCKPRHLLTSRILSYYLAGVRRCSRVCKTCAFDNLSRPLSSRYK